MKELETLRAFSADSSKFEAACSLLKKYERGRRSASDVLRGVAALEAQNLRHLADDMLLEAMDRVKPVPVVLYVAACRRLGDWPYARLRYMFTVARTHPCYVKHLLERTREFLKTEGVVAVVYEAAHHKTPWAVDLLDQALRSIKDAAEHTAEDAEDAGDNDVIRS